VADSIQEASNFQLDMVANLDKQLLEDMKGKGMQVTMPDRNAFRTATGVHAAAIIKAKKKGEDWLADIVYSGVPAGMVGKHQEIEVGFMSGMSNIVYWLHAHGIEPLPHLVEEILRAAKERNRVLSDDEILEICKFEAEERKHPVPMDTLDQWKDEVEGI